MVTIPYTCMKIRPPELFKYQNATLSISNDVLAEISNDHYSKCVHLISIIFCVCITSLELFHRLLEFDSKNVGVKHKSNIRWVWCTNFGLYFCYFSYF